MTISNDPTVSGSGERRPTTKESILALYNLSKPSAPPTTSAPAVGANSGSLLFSLTMERNRSLLFDEEYNKEYKPMHFFYSPLSDGPSETR